MSGLELGILLLERHFLALWIACFQLRARFRLQFGHHGRSSLRLCVGLSMIDFIHRVLFAMLLEEVDIQASEVACIAPIG